jgi:hypothetical protein
MIVKWSEHSQVYEQPMPYGEEASYLLAAEWLDGCGELVRDWGCGYGYARKFFTKSKYEGIDGDNKLADRNGVDLETFREKSDGILIRYVLEHNHAWATILKHAVESFRRRMFLDITIAPSKTGQVYDTAYPNSFVPNLSIPREFLLCYIGPFLHHEEIKRRPNPWPDEHDYLYYLEKPFKNKK